MNNIEKLAELGQSIWLDYIRRSFLINGELQSLVELGLRGMTSNPTIFEKAISGSQDYDDDLARLTSSGKPIDQIYTTLVIDDIRSAADLLRPVYDRTHGADGYVSLEVDPRLARQTDLTLAEALRLWSLVDRPNLMIKIPATLAGLPAIQEAIAAGVNINITLIFSLDRYSQVMEAYLKGLEQRFQNGLPIDQIASVASFFVSRIDTKVDKLLAGIVQQGGPNANAAQSLMGCTAVANAKLAYQQFRQIFEAERFVQLKAHGARKQRPLWASTSTKNPAYPDTMYVQELIGADTVNTLPQETLEAFLDHGQAIVTIEDELDQARDVFRSLAGLGIPMSQVTQELEDEGVASFMKSFEILMQTLKQKSQKEIAK